MNSPCQIGVYSPIYSLSPLPLLGGPPTPPQLGYIGHPYVLAYTPLPLPPSRIHSALDFSYTSVSKYDVSLDPSSQYPSMLPGVLEESATNPPLRSITIRSPQFPWHIVVTTSGKPRLYVTVSDVLAAIYSNLRTRVTAVEITQLQQDAQAMVKAAYERRCESIPDVWARVREMEEGPKRVDYLGGGTTFLGLSSTSQSPDVWELHTSKGPHDNAGTPLFSPLTPWWGGYRATYIPISPY